MLSSIPSLNRSLDHYGRAAGTLLRSADALAGAADPNLRTVEPANPDNEATPTGPNPDPPRPIERASVELKAAEVGVRGAIALVRAQNELLGSLLDVIV